MRNLTLALALAPIFAATPAVAATVADPVGDFLPSFAGTQVPDLDVTSFSVDFDQAASTFFLQAVFAGNIDPATAGFYVIGVDTGAGAIAPFGGIGNPNVTFDQVIVVQETGATNLAGIMATIAGDMFSLTVPLSLFPSTGADPINYGFNIWPREGTTVTGNSQISDFAPNNTLLSASVPEPVTWMMMLMGFGLAGTAMRFRRSSRPVEQQA